MADTEVVVKVEVKVEENDAVVECSEAKKPVVKEEKEAEGNIMFYGTPNSIIPVEVWVISRVATWRSNVGSTAVLCVKTFGVVI